MNRVVIESPYASDTIQGRKDNITYLRRCLRDSLMRGEAPFASHAIYTQYGVLDDEFADERALGIAAGISWGSTADLVVVYIDRGISSGMIQGIVAATVRRARIEVRALDRVVDSRDRKAVADLRRADARPAMPATDSVGHEPPKQLWFHFHPAPHTVLEDGSEQLAACGDLWPEPYESPEEAQARLVSDEAENAAAGWIVVGPYTHERKA